MEKNTEQQRAHQKSAERLLCLTADYGRVRGLQRTLLRSTGENREKLQAEFSTLLEKSRNAIEKRQASLPKPEFQADLPVNERRVEIADLIHKNQVVIVCGETGSGKTTQLPKICLDLGHRCARADRSHAAAATGGAFGGDAAGAGTQDAGRRRGRA